MSGNFNLFNRGIQFYPLPMQGGLRGYVAKMAFLNILNVNVLLRGDSCIHRTNRTSTTANHVATIFASIIESVHNM